MINKNSRLAVALAILFELILVYTAIKCVISGQWTKLFLPMLAIICILLPFIITFIANKKKILLPSNFQLVTLLFIFSTQYLGEIIGFYDKFVWWDTFLHAVSGTYMVIIALHLIQGIFIKGQDTSKKRFTIFTLIFAFSFAITIGTLWELFEIFGDHIFKTRMVKGGIKDTSIDLVAEILAAFITSIIYYYRILKNKCLVKNK